MADTNECDDVLLGTPRYYCSHHSAYKLEEKYPYPYPYPYDISISI
jgi:hypothetical protein